VYRHPGRHLITEGMPQPPYWKNEAGAEMVHRPRYLGGRKDLVPVLLESGPDVYYTCVANRDIAKRLAMHLFTAQVRVYGTGRWHHEANGQWTLDRFIIGSFDVLTDELLTVVVSALRDLPGSECQTIEDPWTELNAIPHDSDESA
jgi:hypothetical protein